MYWLLQAGLLSALTFYRLERSIFATGATDTQWMGVAAVAVASSGLPIVAIKIWQRKTLWWLVRTHLWVVSLAVMLLAVVPIDWVCVKYNVHLIQSGRLRPALRCAVGMLGLFCFFSFC